VLFVASSVSAYADLIVSFSDLSPSNNVYGVATSAGTEIKSYAGSTPGGIAISFGGGVYGNPSMNGYLTFDLKSTGAATSFTVGGHQDFTGDFKITSNQDGTGTVYVASSGSALTGTSVGVNGASSFSFDADSSSDLTGTLVSGGLFTGPFSMSLHFASINPVFGLTTPSGGSLTIQSFNSVVTGTVSGSAIPEPSTFALFGFGGAGFAINAYRRRKAAPKV
jgi:PEP-CTERM motif